MDTAYPVVAIALAAIAAFSGVGKLRRNAKIVHIVHEVVGVPLQYFCIWRLANLQGPWG